MANNINADDLQKRVDLVTWNTIKKYIPQQPEKNNTAFPPEYGYIIDYYRNNYNIYISVNPRSNSELNDDKTIVFDWKGDLYYIIDNKIKYKFNYCDPNFITVIRTIILEASKFLDTLEQTSTN